MYQLSLQSPEKRFNDGIVVATSNGAHALHSTTSLNKRTNSPTAMTSGDSLGMSVSIITGRSAISLS